MQLYKNIEKKSGWAPGLWAINTAFMCFASNTWSATCQKRSQVKYFIFLLLLNIRSVDIQKPSTYFEIHNNWGQPQP